MILFGRTLFGGPALGRIVTAEGATACVATVQGQGKRTAYHLTPYPKVQCAASVAAKCEKTVVVTGVGVLASAASSVGEWAQFFGHGAVGGSASAVGRQQVDYFDGAALDGVSTPRAAATKTYRLRPAGWARPSATVCGDGDVFALAFSRVICSALPFGTTYYVAAGSANASAAVAPAVAVRTRTAAGLAHAKGAAGAAAEVEFYPSGTSAGAIELGGEPAQFDADFVAREELDVDGNVITPAVGALVVDASGRTAGSASLQSGAMRTHSVSLAVGRAHLVSAPSRSRKGTGRSSTTAQAVAWAEIVLKAEGAGGIESSASGVGEADYILGGISFIEAVGAGAAAARVDFAANASGFGAAAAKNNIVWLTSRGASAPHSVGHGSAVRVAFGDSQCGGSTVVSGAPTAALVTSGKASGRGTPLGWPVFWPKQLVSGSATGAAHVSGRNSVNDAVRAPASRAVLVAASPRLVFIGYAPRQVVVGASLRATAA